MFPPSSLTQGDPFFLHLNSSALALAAQSAREGHTLSQHLDKRPGEVQDTLQLFYQQRVEGRDLRPCDLELDEKEGEPASPSEEVSCFSFFCSSPVRHTLTAEHHTHSLCASPPFPTGWSTL